jgi:nucleoside-diphosphate-sugar epimerase
MILITGGTGQTGRFVVEELLRRNQALRVLARAESASSVQQPGVEVATGDLADLDSLRRAVYGVSGVVHIACTFSDAQVDIAAMQALLDGWQEGPFVFISSLDVYGFPVFLPITEEHPLSETYSDYGRGKVVCERMLAAKAAGIGRNDYALLRAPHILAPHAKTRRRFVEEVEHGEPILLPGADESEWSQYGDAWIDVRDLAWVVAEAWAHPPGGALNVLAGHFRWHELYAMLIRLTGSTSTIVHKPLAEMSVEEQKAKQSYAQIWRFSDERLRQLLGFRPQYGLEATLADVVHVPGSGSGL